MSSDQVDTRANAPSSGNKEACSRCTFLNEASATSCEMCGKEFAELPPVHEVFDNGSWQCGACTMLNQKTSRSCEACETKFTAPLPVSTRIFCENCGFLNESNDKPDQCCTSCAKPLRSRLAHLTSDIRGSTNDAVRDFGMNINVKCPGCHALCSVPPATSCLRCGQCQTYFASPSVGELTNFHFSKLASSVRGLFQSKKEAPASEAPVGRLIAMGEKVAAIEKQKEVKSWLDERKREPSQTSKESNFVHLPKEQRMAKSEGRKSSPKPTGRASMSDADHHEELIPVEGDLVEL